MNTIDRPVGEPIPSPTWEATKGAPLRLLAADDSEDLLDSFGMVLRLLGHRVVTARDGAEAIRIADWWHPQVAFLDLSMGGISGLDVARAVRDGPHGASVMLVAITGSNGEDSRQDAANAGFDRYLLKPVNLDALRELLTEAVGVLHGRGGLD